MTRPTPRPAPLHPDSVRRLTPYTAGYITGRQETTERLIAQMEQVRREAWAAGYKQGQADTQPNP